MTANGCATLVELRDALASKAVSATELASEHLRRIAADTTGSFITVCEEEALTQAKQADAAIARHDHRDLLGLPIAHKDVFCTSGVRTTCASKMLADFVPPYDATVVAKLRTAGMVLLGKTNMDEFAMGSSTQTSHFGETRNPWDAARAPGGSSGGSAAAVAADLVPATTGTDTGGSIRQPAALCGISGLKPTYGRVSRYGMIAFASSLDQGGPMARSAADLRLLLAHMEGHDERDSTSANAPRTGEVRADARFTIGVPSEYWDGAEERLEPGLAAALEDAAATLERLGHKRRVISLPHTRFAVPTYHVVASAEASTNLARYDGVRYGHRSRHAESLEELYVLSRSEGFGAEVKRRILTGTYALSMGCYDAYYGQAQRVRRLILQDFLDAFAEVDAILAPAAPTAAFPLSSAGGAEDPTAIYQQDAFTAPASLAGVPAVSVPCGFTAHPLPIGMQIIGPHFGEDRLLALAEAFQRETDWHQRRPLVAARS